MKHYAGCITAMDEQIGRLRTELKNIKADNNTILTFCSDNGPENGNPGITGGFKARKRSLHEGGIRVPGLLVWPKAVKKDLKQQRQHLHQTTFQLLLIFWISNWIQK